MDIKLNLNIFLFIVFFFLTGQIEIYALVMVFALIHELSHLLCGVLLGFKVNSLKILPFGFSIEFESVVEDYNKKVGKSNMFSVKKIIVDLAGPLINLLIVLLGVLLKANMNIIYSNLLMSIFNLLPIYPLDGGRILQNVLKILVGNRRASTYTNTVSNVFTIILTMLSSILIILYRNIAILVIIIVVWVMTIKENVAYNTYNKIYKTIDKSYNYL